MWWRLALLFTIVPAVELFLLLQLGSWLGPLPTFALILVTGVAGGWLAKREGFAVLRELSAELSNGLPPGERLVEGALVLLGGALLVTPGVLTDLAGILLIVRPTRRWLAPRLTRSLAQRFDVGMGAVGADPEQAAGDGVRVRAPGAQRPRAATPHPFASPFDDLP